VVFSPQSPISSLLLNRAASPSWLVPPAQGKALYFGCSPAWKLQHPARLPGGAAATCLSYGVSGAETDALAQRSRKRKVWSRTEANKRERMKYWTRLGSERFRGIILANFWRHGATDRNRSRLVNRPSLLLLDEPFSALDASTRGRLQEHLLQLWTDRSLTLFFVTHDIEEAVRLADCIIVIKGRPGRISHQFQIDLPRPRVRSDKEFPVSRERVLAALQEESGEANG